MSEVATVLVALGTTLLQVCHGQAVHRPGDSGPALKAEISAPQAIAVDGSQTLYIAENDGVIRQVDSGIGIGHLDDTGSAVAGGGNVVQLFE